MTPRQAPKERACRFVERHLTRARVLAAVGEQWTLRREQNKRADRKRTHGTSGETTAGEHLDPLIELVAELLKRLGFEAHAEAKLPSTVQFERRWNLVAVNRDARSLLAFEFRSQAGPSISKNYANRCQEFNGAATDLRCAA